MVTFVRRCYRDDMRVGGRIVSSNCGMLSFILFIVYLSHSNIYLFGLYNIVLESNKSQDENGGFISWSSLFCSVGYRFGVVFITDLFSHY